jgi:hypothetical protein
LFSPAKLSLPCEGTQGKDNPRSGQLQAAKERKPQKRAHFYGPAALNAHPYVLFPALGVTTAADCGEYRQAA